MSPAQRSPGTLLVDESAGAGQVPVSPLYYSKGAEPGRAPRRRCDSSGSLVGLCGGRAVRRPAVDAFTAANWTAVGILANESCEKGGERVFLPAFTLEKLE